MYVAPLICDMRTSGRKSRRCKLPPIFKVLCSLPLLKGPLRTFLKEVSREIAIPLGDTGEQGEQWADGSPPAHLFQDQLYLKTGLGSLLNIPTG